MITRALFYGGSIPLGYAPVGDFTLPQPNLRLWVISPGKNNAILTLPNPDDYDLRNGGPIYYLLNVSVANSIIVKNVSGDTIGTLALDKCFTMFLASRAWYFRESTIIS